jgi:hyperosmotically inducible protein
MSYSTRMSYSKCLLPTLLVYVVFAGSACTGQAVDDTKRTTGTAIDATKKGADKAVDATKAAADETKEIAGKAADKTKEIVGEVAKKSQQVASTTAEVVSDGWITTKVKAKFADEKLLEGSDIHVDTNDHMITLRGTVPSRAAKARAMAIASGTERVTRVVDHLVVD